MKHSPPEDKNENISVWGVLIMEGAVEMWILLQAKV